MSKINKNDSNDDGKENSDNKDMDSGFIPSSSLSTHLEIDYKDERSSDKKKSSKTAADYGKEAEMEDLDSGILVSAELSSKISDLKIENDEEPRQMANPSNKQQHQQQQQPQQPWEIYYQQTKEGGDTQLHFACVDGLEKVVAALIRLAPHSCLFNIQNNDCQTAMHLATLSSKPKIIRMLLIAGADPVIRDRHGNNALHLASEAGDLQCVKALTTPISKSEIQEAHRNYGHRSQDKSTSYLRKPPQLPFDLEFRNYDGERCVHLAAMGGHVDVLRELVYVGADINSKVNLFTENSKI
ncbi:NFKBIA family protein [Megaselia abdita]